MADIRKRLRLGALPLTLLGVLFVVATAFFAADATASKHSAMSRGIASGSAHRLLLTGSVSAFMQKSDNAYPYKSNVGKRANTSDSTDTTPPAPTAGMNQTTNTSTTSNGSVTVPVSNSLPRNDQTPPSSLSVQLAGSQPACQQGRESIDITSAQVIFLNKTNTNMRLVWYWESNAGSTGSATSPVPPDQNSLAMPAGSGTVAITGSDPSQPLLSAPEIPDYSYTVRLHIITPVDAVSDWIPVPRSSGPCQQ